MRRVSLLNAYLYVDSVITQADVVAAVGRLSALFVRVCLCVCQQSKTKTTGHIITKLGRWIVDDKPWSLILFEFAVFWVRVL